PPSTTISLIMIRIVFMLLKLIACPGRDGLQIAHAIASDGSGHEVPTRGRFRAADSAGGPARKCLLSKAHGCFSGVASGQRRGQARQEHYRAAGRWPSGRSAGNLSPLVLRRERTP